MRIDREPSNLIASLSRFASSLPYRTPSTLNTDLYMQTTKHWSIPALCCSALYFTRRWWNYLGHSWLQSRSLPCITATPVSPPCITDDCPIHQMYGFLLNAHTKVSQLQLSFCKLSRWHRHHFHSAPPSSIVRLRVPLCNGRRLSKDVLRSHQEFWNHSLTLRRKTFNLKV